MTFSITALSVALNKVSVTQYKNSVVLLVLFGPLLQLSSCLMSLGCVVMLHFVMLNVVAPYVS